LLLSCAQQTSLTGGDKDTLAPILLVDSNMSLVNMKQTSINLEFNENIQFLKGKRALITNPPISEVVVTDEKNKIEINEKKKEKINCDKCNSLIRKSDIKKHQKRMICLLKSECLFTDEE